MLTASNNDKMVRTARAAFFKELESLGTRFAMSDFITVMDTDSPQEDFAWLGAVPAPEKWTSTLMERRLKSYDHYITVDTWGHSISFSQNLWDDDKTGTVKQRAGDMAARAKRHVNKLISQMLEAGAASTYGTCYDKGNFFATTHPESGSNQSNSTTLDVTTPTAPTATNMTDAYKTILEAMTILTDDQGEPLDEDLFQNLRILVPSNMRAASAAAFNTNGSFGGAQVLAADATGTTGGARGVNWQVNPYFTGNDTIYALLPNLPGSVAPFALLNRQAWEMQVFSRYTGSKDDAKNDTITYIGKARYGAGYGAWQCAFKLQLV